MPKYGGFGGGNMQALMRQAQKMQVEFASLKIFLGYTVFGFGCKVSIFFLCTKILMLIITNEAFFSP